jgi:hypothetical protein
MGNVICTPVAHLIKVVRNTTEELVLLPGSGYFFVDNTTGLFSR